METITLNKKVLFDLISFVTMVVGDKDAINHEDYINDHIDMIKQIDNDLGEHIDAILNNYI